MPVFDPRIRFIARRSAPQGMRSWPTSRPVPAAKGPGRRPMIIYSPVSGAFTAITLQMYAERKGWQLEDLRVELTLFKNAEGETRIDRVLHCTSELDDTQWQRLLDIAGKTPVTKTLLAGVAIDTRY